MVQKAEILTFSRNVYILSFLFIQPTMQYTQSQLLEKVSAAIEQMVCNPQPDGLYAPIRYALSLGGKRIRPVLMLHAYNIYKEDVDRIMSCAIALETYHNFTLLHDDVMDRAEVRRGRPCVHKVWDENTAILSGDAMLILAYRLLTEGRTADAEPSLLADAVGESDAVGRARALQTFTLATLGVCEGQQYDVEFERRDDVSEAEYMEMIRLKTSLLLACALKMGAELAGAPAADAEHLYEFGEKMGLAFQLQDDLLDVYGDPAVFGKKIGGDILCNKKTFMLINVLQLANEQQRAVLTRWLQQTDFDAEEKIRAVREIYDAVNIRQMCEQKIEQLFAESLRALRAVDVPSERLQPLVDFAYRLMGRQS